MAVHQCGCSVYKLSTIIFTPVVRFMADIFTHQLPLPVIGRADILEPGVRTGIIHGLSCWYPTVSSGFPRKSTFQVTLLISNRY